MASQRAWALLAALAAAAALTTTTTTTNVEASLYPMLRCRAVTAMPKALLASSSEAEAEYEEEEEEDDEDADEVELDPNTLAVVAVIKSTRKNGGGGGGDTATFTIDTNTYACPVSQTRDASVTKCADGSDATPTTWSVPPGTSSGWIAACTAQCVKASLQGKTAKTQCVGFTYTGSDCVLAMCAGDATSGPSTSQAGTLSLRPPKKTKNPRKKPAPSVAVVLSNARACVTAQPKPTVMPTRPCLNPSVPGNLGAFNPAVFSQLKPDVRLCEVIQLRGPKPQNCRVLQNFNCDLTSCLRWCQSDTLCMYALYSAKQNMCIKAAVVQTTDTPGTFVDWWTQEWQVYARKQEFGGAAYVPNYSGQCNNMVQKNCDASSECHWRRGKVGWNKEDMGAFANGWCGRIKCNAYWSSPLAPPTSRPNKPKKRGG